MSDILPHEKIRIEIMMNVACSAFADSIKYRYYNYSEENDKLKELFDAYCKERLIHEGGKHS